MDISFDSTQRGEEEGRGGGQGVMCVCEVGSGKWEDLGGRINPREY